MRKVVLTVSEDYTYQIIKDFVHHRKDRNFNRLCLKLGCSKRTAQRKIAGYKRDGKEFFHHKNHHNKPANTISKEVREKIVSIYNTQFYDANFTHFRELLMRYYPEIPTVSLSTIRNIFKEVDILSPKAHKATKRRLKQKDKKQLSLKEPIQFEQPQESTSPHPRRERSKYAGELVYIDASPHKWFGGVVTSLHAAIDDSTGTVLGAYFAEQETLQGYYQMYAQILRNYGIPAAFHTDGRTVFEYKKAGVRKTTNDTPTQFTYACQTLGTAVIPSYTAEAQGKVERLFQTLQSRLPIELRLAGVTTIEQANEFLLKTFLPDFNKEFAATIKDTTSVFEPQLSENTINFTLAVLDHRTVDKGHSICYHNQYYRFLKKDGSQAYLRTKQNVLVIKALDGNLYASCKDVTYALEPIPAHKALSREFDTPTTDNPMKTTHKPYIPPMRHPWRIERFLEFEIYRLEHIYSFPDSWYTQDKFLCALE